MTGFEVEFEQYCKTHGTPDRIELMLCDINGVLRGKWLPGDQVKKLLSGGVRLPLSTYVANILGAEVPETGVGGVIGDPDGTVIPVSGTLKPVPWAKGNVAQVLVELEAGGKISVLSTREVLAKILQRLHKRDLRPVVATELEFYIIQKRTCASDPPKPPNRLPPNQNYDLEVLSKFEDILVDIQSACRIQGILTDTLIAEYGPGQFEINFHHTDDVLGAADMALLFRRLVRGVVENHGLEATFMAKPYANETGNGMHVHTSLLDEHGANLFAASDGLSKALCTAIAGLLETMPEMQAIFAPHMNSYRRFHPSSFSPHRPDWGIDHRGAAIRVPAAKGKAARLEHRISGADVNPYLALAAILGGILHGLDTNPALPLPLDDPDAKSAAPLHHDWAASVDQFEKSNLARSLLGDTLHQIYTTIRRFEIAALTAEISPIEYRTYLSRL